jgi:hypothetical protein
MLLETGLKYITRFNKFKIILYGTCFVTCGILESATWFRQAGTYFNKFVRDLDFLKKFYVVWTW